VLKWFGRLFLPLILVFSAFNGASADSIAKLIAEGSPPLQEGDITLHGCEVRLIFSMAYNDNAYLRRSVLRVDLSHYDLESGSVSARRDGRAVLKVKRAPVSPEMLAMATRAVRASEAGKASAGGEASEAMPEEAIQKIYTLPGGQLRFGLRVLIPQGEAPKPHEDAPGFHGAAEAIASLPAPTTAAISLQYLGEEPAGDRLLSGSVVILPSEINFAAKSKEDAALLGEALSDRRRNTCPAS